MVELELHVRQKELQSGTTCVGWCISEEALKEHRSELEDAFMVICTGKGHHERRKVVRLDDLQAFISFARPGVQNIHAFVLPKKYHSGIDKKWDGTYISSLVKRESGKPEEWDHTIAQGSITVDVPEGVFAKEPPQWEKRWVGWIFRSKPEDQCDWRRRRLFAYTIQPIFALVKCVSQLVLFLFALLFGVLLNPSYILRPLDPWYPNLDESDAVLAAPALAMFDGKRPQLGLLAMPIAYLLAFALLQSGLLWWAALLLTPVMVLCCVLIVMLIGHTLEHFSKDRKFESKIQIPTRIDTLVCDGTDRLSWKNRPIRLHYHALKSMVCKPFAR